MKQYKYKINGNLFNVVINEMNDDVAEVEVNGTPYTVELGKVAKKQMTTAFKKPAQAGTAQPGTKTPVTKQAAGTSSSSLKSPLPGIILEISCNVGDQVKKGQKLIILEAMKMENNIIADRNGSITDIKVRKGDSVMEGAELLTIVG
jgi:Biotin carboxyl carrier protein